MAQRKIHTEIPFFNRESGISHGCKVYRDTEFNEFNVRFYLDNVELESSRYFASDKQDALDTAAAHMKVIRGM